MWGSANWGEMVWSGLVSAVPLLDPWALVALAAAFAAVSTVFLRHRAARE